MCLAIRQMRVLNGLFPSRRANSVEVALRKQAHAKRKMQAMPRPGLRARWRAFWASCDAFWAARCIRCRQTPDSGKPFSPGISSADAYAGREDDK